jgi:glycine reductase
MAQPRVVHFLNQFFAGVGGEGEANLPVDWRAGPVGPGRRLGEILGADAAIAATIWGGDNYFAEHAPDARARVRDLLAELQPSVVVAGPAFDAGRYGVACAEVCDVAGAMGIPAVMAMHPDNPGAALHRQTLIVPTAAEVTGMGSALAGLARLALKLARGEELGPAVEEGYLPRGIRQPCLREKSGRERALDMLAAKLAGRPYRSEMLVRPYEAVAPAPPVGDLAEATLGLITTGGIVPKGNPDRLVRGGADHWFRYAIDGLPALDARDWDCVHRGFHIEMVKENPNYVLPLHVMRELEERGAIKGLYPWFFSTSGVGTAVANAKRMGAEMAAELKEAGVRAAVLVAT